MKRKKKPKEIWVNISELGHDWYAVSQLGRIRANNCTRVYSDGRRRLVKQRRLSVDLSHKTLIVRLHTTTNAAKDFNLKDLVARYHMKDYDPSLLVKYKDTRKSKLECTLNDIYQKDRRYAKSLSDEHIIELRKAYEAEPTKETKYLELAKKYNVSTSAIKHYISGKRRRDIDDSSPYRRRNVSIECIQQGEESKPDHKSVQMAKSSYWKNHTRTNNSSK